MERTEAVTSRRHPAARTRTARLVGPAALAALLALAAMLVLAAAPASGAVQGVVVRVVDGDSVRIKVDGRTRTYRLRGVRAPALKECHGREARERLRRLLPRGAKVRIGGKGRSVTIRRGRRLVNEQVVAGGHAEATGRRGALARLLNRAEDRARDRGRGMWGACADDGERTETTQGPAQGGGPAPPAGNDPAVIAQIDQLLQRVSVYSSKTTSLGSTTTTDERLAHLCADHRFTLETRSLIRDQTGGINTSGASAGTWRVVAAAIDPVTGRREAVVEYTIDQGDNVGSTGRTVFSVDASGEVGRWDDVPAQFARSDRCP